MFESVLNKFPLTFLINEGESNIKLPKMFAGKNLQMTQKKASRADSIKKGLTKYVKNRCVRGR